MKILVVLSVILCSGILANGSVEWQDDLPYDLQEILGDNDYSLPVEQPLEDGSGAVSPCDPNPCRNGGQCQPTPGDEFTCKCLEGFYGDTCEKENPCVSKPCQNGGTCSGIAGDEYVCDCADGFDGDNCEKDIDECTTDKPCLNGATCNNIPGSYECVCATGYTGENCQDDIDECSTSDPCQNGAECENIPGDYRCKCEVGYKGKNCEEDIDECLNDPCLNGATCVNKPGSYECTCPSGHSGKNCEGDIDECLTNNPCLNGATCHNSHGSYRCECTAGYEEEHCGKDIDECQTIKPCQNNGTCKNVPGSYKCTCKAGYTGKNCDKDIDECLSSTACENGATCVNIPGSYRCRCSPGFTGKTCATDINECQSLQPCQNGASCKNVPGSYKCSCITGYTGKDCETDIDECVTSKPCKNGATCVNIPGSYRCTCPPGFTGTNCRKDIDECEVNNGGCSHDCINTIGSYECSCPDAELSLDDDKHTCEAHGVTIDCLQNEMSITIPKTILKGMDREHLRLLDPSCKATETTKYFKLTTPLTGCNSTRRYTKSAIVYSNKVLEIPLKNTDIITRVREIEIPFSCYYSNHGMATAVGIKPRNRKLVFSEKGIGNFTVLLEFFHTDRFNASYARSSFPVSLKLRQQMFVQAKVDSNDKRLSIIAEECFATPTPEENNPKKHDILVDGCAVDDTVELLPSPTGYYRFGLEAFEFINQPFVFIHCHVIICNASNPQSRCAKGCEADRRKRREVEDHKVYSLAQGPITLDYTDEYEENDEGLTAAKKSETKVEVNMPLVAAMAAMTALTMFGVVFMAVRNKPRVVNLD